MLKALRNFIQKRSTWANPEPWFREALGLEETSSGVSVTAESSLRATAVFACVRVLSESVAGLPLHVYRRDGDNRERAADHPLYQVLHDQPNPLQTSYEFRQLLMVWLLLHGNAFAEIVRDAAGNVTELWPLQPNRVTVKAKDGGITYQYMTPGGGTTSLPFASVLHLKGLSTDGFMGLSPIAAARQSIGLSLVAEKFGASYFGKGSRVGGVITMPQALTDLSHKRLQDSWNAKHTGPDGFHSIAILDGGQTFTPFSLSNADAQFLETRKFGVEDICRVMRVSPYKVAHLDKANYSNVDALERAFASDSLMPWTNSIEQAMTVKLLMPAQRRTYFIEHDMNGLLRGDNESRMRSYQAGIYAGIWSPNDCRKRENENPREGGDVYLQPTNLAPSPYNPTKQESQQ
jgi:HK97 family phage portal protein